MFGQTLGLTFNLEQTLTDKKVNGYHEETIRKIQKETFSSWSLQNFNESMSWGKVNGGYFRLKDTLKK